MKYKNFIYNEKSNAVFAYVPKVACTNWKSLLRYMAGHENWLDNKLAHDKLKGGLHYLDIEGVDEAVLNRPGLKKFAMVRDPYSRVLSAYLNKVESRLPPKPEGEGDHFDKIVRDIDAFRKKVLGESAYPGINLEVFLRWLDHGASWFTKDEHWAPQHILLRQPEMNFDFIGKLENLEQDSARILDAMGCDQRFPSQKEVNFAPTGAQTKTNKYFDAVTRRLVERIYSKDFEYFGYSVQSGKAQDKEERLEVAQSDSSISPDIEDALKKNWYYDVELAPGRFTGGMRFKNISVTRRVLESIDVKGATCLDISTMEGMFSTLLARRGANVMATDSIDNRERLDVVKKVYDAKFDYYPHAPVANFADFVLNVQASKSYMPSKKIEHGPYSPYGFDLVLSSGVIYHVLNPIDHIVSFRRLCKTGGLCVIETAALMSNEIEMVHDWRGDKQTWNGNATWYPSARAVEVFLRAAFFEPLGYSYINVSGKTDLDLCRIAVVARAVEERAFSAEDQELIGGSELYKNYDFKPILPSARMTGKSRVEPAVNLNHITPVTTLKASDMRKTPPLAYSEDYLSLKLRDV